MGAARPRPRSRKSSYDRNDVASGGAGSCRERLECRLAACHKYEIVSPFCETIRIDSSDAPRGASDKTAAYANDPQTELVILGLSENPAVTTCGWAKRFFDSPATGF